MKIMSLLQDLTKVVAETFKLSTMEAIGAVATSKTVARIMNNRKADYNVEKEASALIHELKTGMA